MDRLFQINRLGSVMSGGLTVVIIYFERMITDITLRLQCMEMGFLYKGYVIIWGIQAKI